MRNTSPELLDLHDQYPIAEDGAQKSDQHQRLKSSCKTCWNSAVCSTHRIDLINKLEDVQRRFTKKLNSLANLRYAKRLENLGLDGIDALQTRRIKSDSPDIQYCSWTQLHETC